MRSAHHCIGPVLGVLIGALVCQAPAWGHGRQPSELSPWSVSHDAPVFTAHTTANRPAAGLGSTVALGGLWIYQNALDVVMRSECPMHPSCSNYSILAFRTHGAWMGLLLTVDRLLHEESEFPLVPKVLRNGRNLAYDPLSNNDFWWRTRP